MHTKNLMPRLILEALEERIFFDANPLLVALDAPADHLPADQPAIPAPVEAAGNTPESTEEHTVGSQEETPAEKPAEAPVEGLAAGDVAAPIATQASVETPNAAIPADMTNSATAAGGDTHTPGVAEVPATSTAADIIAESPGALGPTADGAPQTATPADSDTGITSAGTSATAAGGDVHTPGMAEVPATSTAAGNPAESPALPSPAAVDTMATATYPDSEPVFTSATASDASILTPIDPMIGEDFSFTVTFDNPGTIDRNADGVPDTVYGPYIDMVFDGGLDAGIGSGAEISNDGITFVNANYLGSSVQSHVQTVGASGSVTHHWATNTSGAPLVVSGLTPGDQFVTLLMPFGSFTPGQTPAGVVVNAHMSINADVNVPLDVDITTGAMFGTDALNNPVTDNPLRGIEQRTLRFLPEVIAFNTDIRVPNVRSDCQEQHGTPDDTRSTESNHQEIPTGPNFPGVYVSTIDVAAGQTVGGPTAGIIYTQHIPNLVFYTGVVSVQNSGGTNIGYTVIQQPTGAAGGDLTLQLDSPLIGTSAANDIVIQYGFYVPETTGTGTSILDPVTGDDGHLINDGEVTYRWTPIDSTHDAAVTATIDAEVDADGNFSDNPDVDDISHLQSIAIQKSHAFAPGGDSGTVEAGTLGTFNPGDVLAYTLDFQLSDYFSFGDVNPSDTDYSFRIDDTVANGLLLTSNPTIEIWEKGLSIGSVSLNPGAVGSQMWTTTETNGDVVVHYNLQAILAGLPGDDILDGGYEPPAALQGGRPMAESPTRQPFSSCMLRGINCFPARNSMSIRGTSFRVG